MRGRCRPRVYDEAARRALIVLWEVGDRVCGKRLKALLPILIPALERLQLENPGVFPDAQLHTPQRRLKQWRVGMARLRRPTALLLDGSREPGRQRR
jgi:hypothetical protein